MSKWLKIFLISLAGLIVVAVLIFVLGTVRTGRPSSSSSKPPSSNPAASSDVSGFELKKSNNYYTVYYHTGDDTNADKTLTLLDKAVTDYYQKYYGITPQNTPIYLAKTVEEYVKIADFPGGAANVQIGDGSAPNGKIYLYKPFNDPQKGEGVIVHEGTHAAINWFLGGGQQMEKMPGFLNEGMAYNAEYIYNAGTDYDPLKEIYYTDLLKRAAKTGSPALMSLEELGKNCTGYISDSDRNGLCRGEGSFIVWYMVDKYGNDFWAKFLTELKSSDSWQASLEKISGKNINQLGQEIDDTLKTQTK